MNKDDHVVLSRNGWIMDDRAIRGEVAKYCAMRGIRVEDLGQAIGVSRTAMYMKLKQPSQFRLREIRLGVDALSIR